MVYGSTGWQEQGIKPHVHNTTMPPFVNEGFLQKKSMGGCKRDNCSITVKLVPLVKTRSLMWHVFICYGKGKQR